MAATPRTKKSNAVSIEDLTFEERVLLETIERHRKTIQKADSDLRIQKFKEWVLRILLEIIPLTIGIVLIVIGAEAAFGLLLVGAIFTVIDVQAGIQNKKSNKPHTTFAMTKRLQTYQDGLVVLHEKLRVVRLQLEASRLGEKVDGKDLKLRFSFPESERICVNCVYCGEKVLDHVKNGSVERTKHLYYFCKNQNNRVVGAQNTCNEFASARVAAALSCAEGAIKIVREDMIRGFY